MKILSCHENFKLPERKTDGAAGYDLFQPEDGEYRKGRDQKLYTLGFAMEVPVGYGAFILPRSGAGMNLTVELNNSIGLIDSDYRGAVAAKIRSKDGRPLNWSAGDRLLQMVILPVHTPTLELVQSLDVTARGESGFGSTGR